MQRKINQILQLRNDFRLIRAYSETVEDDFRVLNLRAAQNVPQRMRRQRRTEAVVVPRTEKMSDQQEWASVWPGPKTFHPASVPLPLRQGYNVKGAPPSKYANAELMKIPNFLHLTPLAIKKQCESLKQFCTQWPKELISEQVWEKYYPVKVITSDYCHGLPTIRNPLARIVSIKIKLPALKFDSHSKDKFLRLLGEHYSPETDMITITSDRCPARQQNYSFCLYILTASYFESFVTEPWEELKVESDMISYDFNRNKSKQTIEEIIKLIKENNPNVVPKISLELSSSVEKLINELECDENLENYKTQVKQVLGL